MTASDHDERDDDARLRRHFTSVRGRTAGDHPSEDDWARFAAREMDPAAQAAFADHVVECTECAEIYRAVAVVRRGPPGLADASVAGIGANRRWWWQGLAAAAAIVGLTSGSVWWLTRASDDEAPQTTRQDPIAPAPADTPAAEPSAGTSAGPAAIERWAHLPPPPEVRLPPSLVLAMRGADSADQAFLAEFGAAIAPYRSGRYAEAASALAALAERRPDVAEVWFYLGVSRLYGQSPADAVAPIRRAQPSEVVGDEARWLEAVALQHAGRSAEAQSALSALCAAPGPNRARACAARTAVR